VLKAHPLEQAEQAPVSLLQAPAAQLAIQAVQAPGVPPKEKVPAGQRVQVEKVLVALKKYPALHDVQTPVVT